MQRDVDAILCTQKEQAQALVEIISQLNILTKHAENDVQESSQDAAAASGSTKSAPVPRSMSHAEDEVASFLEDEEVRQLLVQDKAFERILARLQAAKELNNATVEPKKTVFHPESRIVNIWEISLICVLAWTCVIVPLKLAFDDWFASAAWRTLDVVIDTFFLWGVAFNFFIGYRRDDGGMVELDRRKIAKRYLKGWFFIDSVSSIPFDSMDTWGLRIPSIFKLNKVLRILRLFKAINRLCRSKMIANFTKKYMFFINPAVIRLFELVMVVILIWHYIGCLWWYVARESGMPTETRLLVLQIVGDVSELPNGLVQYLAAFYWATMMTTGLNVAAGPGNSAGQISYEILVTFLGICMQAYILGAASSEIANMDATSKLRRQKLESIKSHLRYLRVPAFLTLPIIEFYETLFAKKATFDESDILKDMPSSLKVQLAVVLNEEFLKKVPFFQFLEPRIIATLVLCLRSRVYLPFETVIHQGDVGIALFFIRAGGAEVLKQGAGEGDDEMIVTRLHEFACFGEQSFLLRQPSMATVRSIGYSEIMWLVRSDFEAVCEMFPALKVHVLGVQKELNRNYHKLRAREAVLAQRNGGCTSPSRGSVTQLGASSKFKAARAIEASSKKLEISRSSTNNGRKAASALTASAPQVAPWKLNEGAAEQQSTTSGAS